MFSIKSLPGGFKELDKVAADTIICNLLNKLYAMKTASHKLLKVGSFRTISRVNSIGLLRKNSQTHTTSNEDK